MTSTPVHLLVCPKPNLTRIPFHPLVLSPPCILPAPPTSSIFHLSTSPAAESCVSTSTASPLGSRRSCTRGLFEITPEKS
ncbi:hypothetical protein E2C01_092053 [Portunus trituberculatus]|uniref:Uncharacterized protein n=1 Tax=Portunus trituberculatus TaxID=210409 RepID=A0A5B7JQB8_PORTR|nr:hypothetical protein [Portunus trituberculatus]